MKTNMFKWSRLLFIMIMVLAMITMIMPAAVQADCDTCPSVSCNLDVNIVLPADGTSIDKGDYFWVDATVAMPLDVKKSHQAIENVSATLNITGPAELAECCATQGPVVLNSCNEIVDFWWKLQCLDCGDVVLSVSAASESTICALSNDYYAGTSAETTIHQLGYVGDPRIIVDGVECAGEDCVNGTCPLPSIPIGSDFVVKANLNNVTDDMIQWVEAFITIDGPAHLNASNGPIWQIGDLASGCPQEVGWSLVCDGPGDVKITIDANAGDGGFNPDPPPPDSCSRDWTVESWTCTVHQICPAALAVSLSGAPEKICDNCSNTFTVTAEICDTCVDTAATDVFANLTLTGPAMIKNNGSSTKTVCDQIDAGDCADISWIIVCTGPGEVTMSVTATANDADTGEQITATSNTQTTLQLGALMVNIDSPADKAPFNVCEAFDFVYTVNNCGGVNVNTSLYAGLDLTSATNVDVEDVIVHVKQNRNGGSEFDATATETAAGSRIWTAPIDCLCKCCNDTITWHLKCTGSDLVDCVLSNEDIIKGFAGLTAGDVSDSDTVQVIQMCKAHLAGSVQAYEGTVTEDNLEGCNNITAIAVGETFTVVAAIGNLGEAEAQDIEVTLGYTGDVTINEPLMQTIDNITCHGAAKVTWTMTCSGQGPTEFWLAGLSGKDVNYVAHDYNNGNIPDSNIDKGCSINVCQIPVTVTIIQPVDNADFVVGECWTIKAKIQNNTDTTISNCDPLLTNLYAELQWPSQSGEYGCMTLSSGQGNPIELNDLGPGKTAEVSWQVCCCGAGDVPFTVEVYSVNDDSDCDLDDAHLFDISSDIITIHQWMAGVVGCEITSPNPVDWDMCHENEDDPVAYYGTGEVFSVTGRIYNFGGLPIIIDSIDLQFIGDGSAEVISGPTPDPVGTTLAAHVPGSGLDSDEEGVAVSWTVRVTEPGRTGITMAVDAYDPLSCHASSCHKECLHEVFVAFYEAAYLQTAFTSYPTGEISVGTTFSVTGTVTNLGVGDASNVLFTLSDPDSGVTGESTQSIGSVYGTDNPVNYATVTWTLKKTLAGPITLTLSASGTDEDGYQVKEICGYVYDGPMGATPCCSLLLDANPNSAIQDGSGVGVYPGAKVCDFIEEASITVGEGTVLPEGDTVTVSLKAGWNLFSMPWYADSEGTGQDPSTVLADVLGSVVQIRAYDACTPAWSSWIKATPNPTFMLKDGQGYWIEMSAAADLELQGVINPDAPASPPSYSVCVGWNQIGYKEGTTSEAMGTYLAGTSFGTAWAYYDKNSDGTGEWVSVNSSSNFTPGLGYWVYFTVIGEIAP